MAKEELNGPSNRTRFLYVIGSGVEGQPIKIGISRNPQSRIAEMQTSNPFPLSVLHSIEMEWSLARKAEAFCHREMKAKNTSGEWFLISTDEAVLLIGKTLDLRLWEKKPAKKKKKPKPERKPKKKMAEDRMHIRIPPDVKQSLKEMSDEAGMTMSSFLLRMMLETAAERGYVIQ